jgi:hypothetical protein
MKIRKKSAEDVFLYLEISELFHEKSFQESVHSFVDEFHNLFSDKNQNLCECIISVHANLSHVCMNCQKKSSKFRNFLEVSRDKIVTHALFMDSKLSEVDAALRILESNLVNKLYPV